MFYRVLLGFNGFYWVLLGFTGFYWVLLGFAGFQSILVGLNVMGKRFTGYYWVLPDLNGFFCGIYWIRLLEIDGNQFFFKLTVGRVDISRSI